MKKAPYFYIAQQKPGRDMITEEMIQRVIDSPIKREIQSDGRIRCWAWIGELGHFLRVILLSDEETVFNFFLDGRFKP